MHGAFLNAPKSIYLQTMMCTAAKPSLSLSLSSTTIAEMNEMQALIATGAQSLFLFLCLFAASPLMVDKLKFENDGALLRTLLLLLLQVQSSQSLKSRL